MLLFLHSGQGQTSTLGMTSTLTVAMGQSSYRKAILFARSDADALVSNDTQGPAPAHPRLLHPRVDVMHECMRNADNTLNEDSRIRNKIVLKPRVTLPVGPE
eukprot:6116986-Amphidinium_carterae.1